MNTFRNPSLPAWQPIGELPPGVRAVGTIDGTSVVFDCYRNGTTDAITATFETTVPLLPPPTHFMLVAD